MKISDLFEGRVATWSNLLSILRVLMTPAITVALYYESITGNAEYCKIAILLYCIIALSDFVDGYLARLLHQVSRLGQFLDPIADKCVILIIAITLYYFRQFPLWMIALIIIRDTFHVILGFYLFHEHDIQVRPSMAGKCMVAMMGLCGFIFILNPSYTFAGYTLQQISLAIVLVFIILSSISHWRMYAKFYFTDKR